MKHLSLLLDSRKDGDKITGAVIARCISAVSRKCAGIKISMTLYGTWRNFGKQLEIAELPNVQTLTMYLAERQIHRADISQLKMKIWEIVFSGSTFPDLQAVYLNTLMDSNADMPANMLECLKMVADRFDPRSAYGTSSPIDHSHYYGLLSMKEIKLEFNTFLTASVLQSLLGSSIIPKRLTTLEIVNCPYLDPVTDLEALITLFQRGLQLLRFLKVHLVNERRVFGSRNYEMSYISKINEQPDHHLCNIVRELGQSIRGLDLALPFACNRIFVPPTKAPAQTYTEPLEFPPIPAEPLDTLPQRLMAAGYRYRRLLFYGICRGAHKWEEMAALACEQGGNISWELLSEPDDKAVWCVSQCLPVEFSTEAAMQQPFNLRSHG